MPMHWIRGMLLTIRSPLGSTGRHWLAECLQRLKRQWPVRIQEDAAISPGATLLSAVGRFVIERELGRGGFGVVFLARDSTLERQVALKVPRLETLLSPAGRGRFLREARVTAALDHPHIVPIYGRGRTVLFAILPRPIVPGRIWPSGLPGGTIPANREWRQRSSCDWLRPWSTLTSGACCIVT